MCNARCATIQILNYRFTFAIFEFLFDNAENDTVRYHMQVKQVDTPAKCYLQAFFKMVVFTSTGAWLWTKLVEMEENGI